MSQQETCELNLIITGTKDSVVMIEGSAKEISEQKVTGAIKFAQSEIERIIEMEEEIREKVGKKKLEFNIPFVDETLFNEIRQALGDDLNQVYNFKEMKARAQA